MSINPAVERTFTLSQGKQFGCDRAYETIRKWVDVGVENRKTGELVKLETIWVGGTRETSREAYIRFLLALNRAPATPAS